jgi:hypothetical protein
MSTFDEWFNSEDRGLILEAMHILGDNHRYTIRIKEFRQALRAAYDVGYEQGKFDTEDLMGSG